MFQKLSGLLGLRLKKASSQKDESMDEWLSRVTKRVITKGKFTGAQTLSDPGHMHGLTASSIANYEFDPAPDITVRELALIMAITRHANWIPKEAMDKLPKEAKRHLFKIEPQNIGGVAAQAQQAQSVNIPQTYKKYP